MRVQFIVHILIFCENMPRRPAKEHTVIMSVKLKNQELKIKKYRTLLIHKQTKSAKIQSNTVIKKHLK